MLDVRGGLRVSGQRGDHARHVVEEGITISDPRDADHGSGLALIDARLLQRASCFGSQSPCTVMDHLYIATKEITIFR